MNGNILERGKNNFRYSHTLYKILGIFLLIFQALKGVYRFLLIYYFSFPGWGISFRIAETEGGGGTNSQGSIKNFNKEQPNCIIKAVLNMTLMFNLLVTNNGDKLI